MKLHVLLMIAVPRWPPVKNSMHLCPHHPNYEAPPGGLWIPSRFSHATSWLEGLKAALRTICQFPSTVAIWSLKCCIGPGFFLQEVCTLPDCIGQIRRWYILFWNPCSLSGISIRGSITPFISNYSWDLGHFSETESIPVNLPFLLSLIKLCSHFVHSSAVIVFLPLVYGIYTVGFSLFVCLLVVALEFATCVYN